MSETRLMPAAQLKPAAQLRTAAQLRIAALQMVSGGDVEANLAQAGALLASAAAQGAQLVVLPETFALFNAAAQAALGAQEAGPAARVRPFLAEQAARYGLYIVAGTLPLLDRGDPRPRAATLVFDPAGREVGRYDKLHLFDVAVADGHGRYCESATFEPGEAISVVSTPWGGLGLAVCYDLRFPELFQALRRAGASLLAVPAAFTRHTGLAHWLPLLRARAIETQCLVIGANQGGRHGATRFTSGGSAIVDAWGEVVGEAGFGSGVIIATVDLAAQAALRRDMPVAAHRRFDVSGPAPAGRD